QGNDQQVPSLSRRLQVLDMPDVQQVEYSVAMNDFFPALPKHCQMLGKVFKPPDFAAGCIHFVSRHPLQSPPRVFLSVVQLNNPDERRSLAASRIHAQPSDLTNIRGLKLRLV